MNIQQMLEKSREYDMAKADYEVGTNEILFTDVGLAFNEPLFGSHTELAMTDWALGQVCNKLGPPPLNYMRLCPDELRSENLNYWRERVEKTWLIRAYENDARAVLSDRYSVLQNTEVLETLDKIVGETVHEPIQPEITPDSMHLKLKTNQTDTGDYGQGVYVGNGETGNYKLRIHPFVQRTSCTNSIVWKGGGIELRHININTGDLVFAMKRWLGETLLRNKEVMERIVEAETETIPDFAEYVQKFCDNNGITEIGYGIVMAGSEGEETKMALVNGVTHYAKNVEDYDEEIRLETLGGSLLMGNRAAAQI
jgi:hypothetical protein